MAMLAQEALPAVAAQEGDGDAAGGAAPPPQLCAVCGCELEPPELRLCWCGGGRACCSRCCFRTMDPFRPVLEDDHVLHMTPISGPLVTISIPVPDLREWRKQGQEVEVRMLRRWGGEQVECGHTCQTWPRFLNLEVNGREVLAVKPPRRLRKRRDLPQSISANLRRGENEMEVCAEDERRGDFVLAVVRTSRQAPEEFVNQVTRGTYEDSLARVRQLLAARPRGGAVGVASVTDASGADGVECIGDERLRLLCPLTLMRPATLPVRGEACTHLQCMDLLAYLIANFRTKAFNSRWRCPVCSLRVRLHDLRVDGFVEALLAATCADVEEVLVAADGSWRPAAAAPAGPAEGGAAAAAALVEDGEEGGGPAAPQTPPEIRGPPPRPLPRPRAPLPRSQRSRKSLYGPTQQHSLRASKKKLCRSSKAKKEARSSKHWRENRGPGTRAARRPPPAAARPAAARPAAAPRAAAARRRRAPPPPPRHAIAVDSDAPPEEVSDSGPEEGRPEPGAGLVGVIPQDAATGSAAPAAAVASAGSDTDLADKGMAVVAFF